MQIVPKLGMLTIEKIEAELMNNFKFGELSKSELCAQTRASSLAGGMPVW